MDSTDMENKSFMQPSRMSSSNTMVKLAIALSMICSGISLIAIILAARSLSQGGTVINVGGGVVGGSASPVVGSTLFGKIWTFAIGHSNTSGEYIDEISGTLRGFNVDIVNAVCIQANKNCRIIWDLHQNCWDSEAGQKAHGGIGLMAKWYDACAGWHNTFERGLTFQFSSEFRKADYSAFYVKAGNPNNFNPTNIARNQKIGFLDGWVGDETCLERNSDTITGVPLDSATQVVHFQSTEQLSDAVNNNEVAAAFVSTFVYADGALETVGSTITNCHRGGISVMSRKDNTLNNWWNPAFDELKRTGKYRNICDSLSSSHGHKPGKEAGEICVD